MEIENLKKMIEKQQSVKLSVRQMRGSLKGFTRLQIIGKIEDELDFVYLRALRDKLEAIPTVQKCFIDPYSIMVQYV